MNVVVGISLAAFTTAAAAYLTVKTCWWTSIANQITVSGHGSRPISVNGNIITVHVKTRRKMYHKIYKNKKPIVFIDDDHTT